MEEDAVLKGDEENGKLLRAWKHFEKHDFWPDYTADNGKVGLPGWHEMVSAFTG